MVPSIFFQIVLMVLLNIPVNIIMKRIVPTKGVSHMMDKVNKFKATSALINKEDIIINEKSSTDNVKLTNKNGLLYKKPNSDGLWWKTGSLDVNVVNGRAKNIIVSDSGSVKAPSYAFALMHNTGLFLGKKNSYLGISYEGNEKIAIGTDSVKITPLLELVDQQSTNIHPSTNSGILFKRRGDNGLWWRTRGRCVDISRLGMTGSELIFDDPIEKTTIPKKSIDVLILGGNTLSAKNHDLYWNDIRISPGKLSIQEMVSERVDNVALPINESIIEMKLINEDLEKIKDQINAFDKKLTYIIEHKNDGDTEQLVKLKTELLDKIGDVASNLSKSTVDIIQPNIINTSGSIYESFITSADVKAGQVLGILDDGSNRVEPVSGSVLGEINVIKHNNIILSNWSNFKKYDLYTLVSIINASLTITVSISIADTTNNNHINANILTNKPIASISTMLKNKVSGAYKAVLLPVSNGRFVLLYGPSKNTTELNIIKYSISINESDNSLNFIEESVVKNTTYNAYTDFTAVYDFESVDIMTIIFYSDTNDITAILAKISDNSSEIKMGCDVFELSSEISIFPDKSLKAISLPGLMVMIAYANIKLFILLPSAYDDVNEIVISSPNINTDSEECICMEYDKSHSSVVSIEKSYVNTAFIQVFDTFGDHIITKYTKKLGNNLMYPFDLKYNELSNKFMMFYTDAANKVMAQCFMYDGNEVVMNMLHTIDTTNSNNMIYGFNAHTRNNGVTTVEWIRDKGSLWSCNFDSNYRVQPNAYIGIAINNAKENTKCLVAIRGQIYTSDDKAASLPVDFIGKKLYLDNSAKASNYPSNFTTSSFGNIFIGTCITRKKILIGL